MKQASSIQIATWKRLSKHDRNADVLSMRDNGATLQAIAVKHGISPQRVGQIIKAKK